METDAGERPPGETPVGLARRRAPGASTERGRRTRDAIVEAAATTMYENGVAAAPLPDALNLAVDNIR